MGENKTKMCKTEPNDHQGPRKTDESVETSSMDTDEQNTAGTQNIFNQKDTFTNQTKSQQQLQRYAEDIEDKEMSDHKGPRESDKNIEETSGTDEHNESGTQHEYMVTEQTSAVDQVQDQQQLQRSVNGKRGNESEKDEKEISDQKGPIKADKNNEESTGTDTMSIPEQIESGTQNEYIDKGMRGYETDIIGKEMSDHKGPRESDKNIEETTGTDEHNESGTQHEDMVTEQTSAVDQVQGQQQLQRSVNAMREIEIKNDNAHKEPCRTDKNSAESTSTNKKNTQEYNKSRTLNEDMDDTGHELTRVVAQAQCQLQLQRSVEASKQMLYGVCGNVFTILEEYEQRELSLAGNIMDHKMPKSDIYIPDQSHKTFEDIESNVRTQLLLFETQTKVCPSAALTKEVNEELKRKTLAWSAVREAKGIKEIQRTDYYLSKLYEILAEGATHHQTNERQEVTEEVMKEGIQAYMYGYHDRADLDRKFKQNPDEKATGPKTRNSEMLKEGADRISRAHGDNKLDWHLQNDLDKFLDLK